jgi:hypothetical protein
MTWIRNPWWDGFWILSGGPIAVMMVILSLWVPVAFLPHLCPPLQPCNPAAVFGSMMIIYSVVTLDMGHNIAPMVAAWTHPDFRRVMLSHKIRFIGLPIFLLVAGTVAGIVGDRWFHDFQPFINSALVMGEMLVPRLTNPFWWLIVVYSLWNLYHFAMQNYGVLSIYRHLGGFQHTANQRRIDTLLSLGIQLAVVSTMFIGLLPAYGPLQETVHLIYILAAVVVFLLVARESVVSGRWWSPRTIFVVSQVVPLLWPGIVAVATNGINHWLVSIGLASRENRLCAPSTFAAGIIVIGVALFWLLFWNGRYSWNPREMIYLALPYTGFRLALGFWHFCQDRWNHRFRDPRVRATIGRDLFVKA